MKFYTLLFIICAFLASCAGKTQKGEEAKEMTKDKKEMSQDSKEMADKKAKEGEAMMAGEIKCTLAKDTRTLMIEKKEPGCELWYTKMGEKKSMARSSATVSYCEKVQDKIQGNLENAGFTCAQ